VLAFYSTPNPEELEMTCTVSTGPGRTCGAPAVATFTTKAGTVYSECAVHAPASATAAPATVEEAPAAHPYTETRHPFVLVSNGRIVGYAASRSQAVQDRAAKLHAKIVKVNR
jgi:hypothetical protein